MKAEDIKVNIIYYHGACPDGWCAAYIAKMRYPEAELVPLVYGAFEPEDLIEQVRGKDVLMVDFSLKTRDLCDRVAASAKSFHIYDHHKSALAIIGDAPYATFDMNRSGAGLTWDYLFGKNSDMRVFGGGVGNLRPWWVNYTEDQDLWRFKLPNSRGVNAYLNVQERTEEHWDKMTAEQEPESAAVLGCAVSAHIEYLVKHAMRDLQEGVWVFKGQNYRVGIVNNGHVGTSEIGEAIYSAGYHIALMWREDGNGLMRFGLRSNAIDVGAIAMTFPGGGGHVAAAGFELSIGAGRNLIDGLLGRSGYASTNRCC